MAKGNKGNNQKNNGGGRPGDVGENTKKSQAGRDRNRKQARLRDQRQDEERANGTFYSRVNEGRSTDLVAAIVRGETGNYAFPGDNKPSLHFNVQMEKRRFDVVPVVRFETAQEGHELHGEPFDPKVYLPCHDIVKHGGTYRSRNEDRLWAATQELIAAYLGKKLEEAFQPSEAGASQEPSISTYLKLASSNLAAILEETLGFYVVKEGDQVIVGQVKRLKDKIVFKIVYSENSELPVSEAFVPVHLLSAETLEQVTNDEIYALQAKIHAFMQPRLLKAKEKAEKEKLAALAANPPLNPSGKPMGARQLAKLANKLKKEAHAINSEATREAALEGMRRQAIPLSAAATGKIGYIDLSDDCMEFIIQHHESGGDRVVEVAFMSNNHLLHLAKVEVGTKVFIGQVLAGRVDMSDYGATRLSKEELNAKQSLIGFIRTKMEAAHIKLPVRKPATLKLAA